MNPKTIFLPISLVVFFSLFLGQTTAHADLRDFNLNVYEMSPEEKLDLEWAEKIKKGGFIIHFRHAQREQWPDVTAFDAYEIIKKINARDSSFSSATCLTKQGIEEAKLLGNIFKITSVKFSQVYSSPSCRAIETATYAFGKKFIIDNSLLHRSAIPKRQHRSFDVSLRSLLLNLKITPGSNVAMVGHNSTLTYNNNSIFDLQDSGVTVLPDVEPTGFTVIERVNGKLIPRHVFKSVRFFSFAVLDVNQK
jgi:phosphohistidine phosphatase SixA